MILFGTGHRPEDCEPEGEVRKKVRRALEELQPTVCITGMAAGFDLWFGLEALDHGALVWAAKPWSGHSPRKGDEPAYSYIIENASKVVNVTPTIPYPGPWVYHKRNEWMVDHGQQGLSYWSGAKKGGTYACLKYANSQYREVTNCYDY